MRPGRTTAREANRFEERARRARLDRLRTLLLVLLALALLGGLGYLVWFSPVLTVKEVEVQGVSGAQADEVRRAADVPLGVPLARLDLEGPGRRITSSPLYAEAEVARRWPTTVVLKVTPRRPVLALRTGGSYQLVDEDGVAYRSVDRVPSGVAVATGRGQVPAPGLRAAVAMMRALPEDLRGRVSTVEVEGPSMVTFQVGRSRVRWGDESEPQLKVKVIAALLPRAPGTLDVSAPHLPVTR
ncbi:cell division protein FtsQ/DivIB [Arsenicicoccus dermatophilus]|uniref:cell division protein FtsQ/DivIB n=1 Tax=Arsenicicoccus dermatophilus TaxID=1076331 RepID=UPI0039171322